MESDIPTASFDTVGPNEGPDYTTAGITASNPRENNLEEELKEKV